MYEFITNPGLYVLLETLRNQKETSSSSSTCDEEGPSDQEVWELEEAS